MPVQLIRPIRVVPFRNEFAKQVGYLISTIQRDEFSIPITLDEQSDLKDVPAYYQRGSGNFWVALHGDNVVGTIALLDIGNAQVALRKMFVHQDFRGSALGTARKLLDEALNWAGEKGVTDIFLGTTPKFLAAHRFYEKNGFTEIDKQELPTAFPVMSVDTKFYRCSVKAP